MAETEKVEYKDILRELDAPMSAAELTDLHRTEGWTMMGAVHGFIRFPAQHGAGYGEKIVYYFARKVA